MKLITTASLCSAAFIPGSVFRIDRSGTFEAFKSGQFLKSELNLHPVSKAPLSTADSFVINLECEVGTTKSTCDNVKNTLASAARKIAANLVIYKPIIIKAQYRDFCANTSVETCPLRDVLGGARYSSAFVIKKDGAYYTCNQAVIKQMNTNVNPPFSDVDIGTKF